eukprot:TRINITY_DN5238_c0_g1_i2.p1 TRINITY_DN5238_c0_g1~~TRINITY_DN5238_c0_g1_i2.p1  ORF type:complete len:184 (-),score=66.55 TRINITY_DN5238_c0_g1_i2:124-675(-)
MSTDWEEVNAKLPYARTKDDFAARKELWEAMDVNGNGYLSLAEVTKGVRDVIAVDELFDAIPAINRSFHHCKNVSKNPSEHGPDFIEFREFRLLLQTLRQFFEYYQAFDRVDTGDDDRISKEEFTSDGLRSAMEKWVGPIEDLEAEFDSIDTNGGGQVLFNEFIDWALAKDLDIEDDIEPEDD